MKRLFRLSVWLLIFGLFPIWPTATAQNIQDFKISQFTADYYLSRNTDHTAILKTIEDITAQFPSYDQNHGILRAIPESYLGHTINLKIDSITDENYAPRVYSTYHQNGNLVLKIGDKDTFVHGNQTYIITYESKNVVNILNDHDEFYWDVNGDQWQQPFAAVAANLHIPAELSANLQTRHQCYVGFSGSTDTSRCDISTSDEKGGQLIRFKASNLSSGETVTIVNGFDQGSFQLGPEIAQAQRERAIKYSLIAAAVLAAPVLTAVYLYIRWHRYGRDPKGRGVIIPEYQPYKGLNVLTSDYILEEKLNTKAISALVIELAVRKQIAIYQKTIKKRLARDTKTYSLKLLKDKSDLGQEEKQVIDMFFGGETAVGSEADISQIRSSMAEGIKSLKKSLGTLLTAKGFFSNNPETAGKLYGTAGSILVIGGFFSLLYIHVHAILLILSSLILVGLIVLIFGRYMPSRSQKGTEVHDHMLGLRDYIKLAEADRLKFLQSPAGAEKIAESGFDPNDPKYRVKLFESLLPYAMVFNLEKDWSKQFKDVYNDSPDWYHGNWNTFNTLYLAESLNNFASYNTVNFQPPRSSGGSGFGGGAGGGGGGGGGGGW
jgi:uncharacterized membrane protein YgcG